MPACLAEESGGLMRQSLFAGRRLRASYRNVRMDDILALLNDAVEQDDNSLDSYCLHRPRALRFRMCEEEQ
jgi:hypothetical protein